MMGNEHKVVMITGASSGIGEATARHLAGLGMSVVLGARRAERLASLADEIGPQAAWKATDVTVLEEVEALAALAIERFGRIDVLVNNAGIMPLSPLLDGRVDDWNRMIDINIRGVLHGIHAVLAPMMARGSGTIVNVASTAAHESSAAGSVYSATKYAVKAISEGLRKETTGKVRVAMISPGFTDTELFDAIPSEATRDRVAVMAKAAIPAQAIASAIAYIIGQPNEVAVNDMTIRPLALQQN